MIEMKLSEVNNIIGSIKEKNEIMAKMSDNNINKVVKLISTDIIEGKEE